MPSIQARRRDALVSIDDYEKIDPIVPDYSLPGILCHSVHVHMGL
jgi:hypothetical protein